MPCLDLEGVRRQGVQIKEGADKVDVIRWTGLDEISTGGNLGATTNNKTRGKGFSVFHQAWIFETLRQTLLDTKT